MEQPGDIGHAVMMNTLPSEIEGKNPNGSNQETELRNCIASSFVRPSAGFHSGKRSSMVSPRMACYAPMMQFSLVTKGGAEHPYFTQFSQVICGIFGRTVPKL